MKNSKIEEKSIPTNVIDSYIGKFQIATKKDKNEKITDCKVKIISVYHSENNSDNTVELRSTRYESESNNSMSSADRTYDDDDMYAYIGSSSDIDWFKVRFGEDGEANFWIGMPERSGQR